MTAALWFAVLLGQAGAGGDGEPADLARMRKELAQPPALLSAPAPVSDPGRAVFRVKIHGWTFDQSVWHDGTMVPLYVRPSMPPVHFEFLQQVTPEFFRSSVLFPGYAHTPYGGVGLAVPLVPVIGAAVKAAKALNRKNAERAAREEVQQTLAALATCRAHPSTPGCH